MTNTNEYMRKYMRIYSANRRKLLIEKLGGKCVVCGSTEKLQFDHIDKKNKNFTLGDRWHRKNLMYDEELKKCQLLCRDCHSRKTTLDLGLKWARGTHGTLSSYRYCHCELCKKAKREWFREYRKRAHNSVARMSSS